MGIFGINSKKQYVYGCRRCGYAEIFTSEKRKCPRCYHDMSITNISIDEFEELSETIDKLMNRVGVFFYGDEYLKTKKFDNVLVIKGIDDSTLELGNKCIVVKTIDETLTILKTQIKNVQIQKIDAESDAIRFILDDSVYIFFVLRTTDENDVKKFEYLKQTLEAIVQFRQLKEEENRRLEEERIRIEEENRRKERIRIEEEEKRQEEEIMRAKEEMIRIENERKRKEEHRRREEEKQEAIEKQKLEEQNRKRQEYIKRQQEIWIESALNYKFPPIDLLDPISQNYLTLSTIIDSDSFRLFDGKLAIVLGVDIIGKPVIVDMAQVAHLFVSGESGVGKSTLLDTIIMGTIYMHDPQDIQLILVELGSISFKSYTSLPRTMIETNDYSKVEVLLTWIWDEIQSRTRLLQEMKVRNIDLYNDKMKTIRNMGYNTMPRILVVIDEISSILRFKKDIRETLSRLLLNARNTGIHFIIADSDTSNKNVKEFYNMIPSKIAFSTNTHAGIMRDFKMGGTDTLSRQGEFIFKSVHDNTPIRVTAPRVSDEEIYRVVTYASERNVEYMEALKRVTTS